MSNPLDGLLDNKPQPFNIQQAKEMTISARAVNEQNIRTAEAAIKSLKQVAARITPEVFRQFMERGIDLSHVLNANWDLLISSEESRKAFVDTHMEILNKLVAHIQTEMKQL